MAGNGQVALQVSDFTLAGIDKMIRTLRIKGNAIPYIAQGSLLTAVIDMAGTGYAANDTVAVAGGTGGVVKVLTVSSGVPQTISILVPGSAYAAATGAATTAIIGTGAGLTVTTTVNQGGLLIISGFSITSNVVTFNCTAVGGGANGLTGGGGQTVIVQGFTGVNAYLNGSLTTASATASAFTASLTAANVGQTTAQGTAVVQPTYTTGGIPLIAGFVDGNGLPRPVAGIGPLASPNRLTLYTKEASVLTYSTNIIASAPLVRIFTSGAELSSGGAITADVIGFLAEYAFGAF